LTDIITARVAIRAASGRVRHQTRWTFAEKAHPNPANANRNTDSLGAGRENPYNPKRQSVSCPPPGRYSLSMKSHRKELWFNLPARRTFVNITGDVAESVRQSGVREGLCLVNAMHITASVYINDDESGLLQDYDEWLEQLAPHEPINRYRHNDTGEDNGDAHLKRQIMGREVVVAVTDGKLDLGPWEQIFYGEFDGRRRKRVLVKIIGE